MLFNDFSNLPKLRSHLQKLHGVTQDARIEQKLTPEEEEAWAVWEPFLPRPLLNPGQLRFVLHMIQAQAQITPVDAHAVMTAYYLAMELAHSKAFSVAGYTRNGYRDTVYTLRPTLKASVHTEGPPFNAVEVSLEMASKAIQLEDLKIPCPVETIHALEPRAWAKQLYAHILTYAVNWIRKDVPQASTIAIDRSFNSLRKISELGDEIYSRLQRGGLTFLAYGSGWNLDEQALAGYDVELLEMRHWDPNQALGWWANEAAVCDGSLFLVMGAPIQYLGAEDFIVTRFGLGTGAMQYATHARLVDSVKEEKES